MKGTNLSPISGCSHERVSCLNQYELVRKYRCGACGGVMMCACDETFGRRFLFHQLAMARELETQAVIPVDLGFVPHIAMNVVVCRQSLLLSLKPSDGQLRLSVTTGGSFISGKHCVNLNGSTRMSMLLRKSIKQPSLE